MFRINDSDGGNPLPEVIAVTSGKGGVGKSFFSVNLAILLGHLKKKVLLFDADIHLGNIDLILGHKPRYSISDVVHEQVSINEAIAQGPGGIDILTASTAVLDMLDMEEKILVKLADAFSNLEQSYDYVVVDTGAGINRNVMSFVLGADKVMLLVTPDPASIADAYGVLKVVRHHRMDLPVLMVVNMIRSQDESESLYKKMNLMVNRFLKGKVTFGGSILRDVQVSDSIRYSKPLVMEFPHGNATASMKVIASKLLRVPVSDAGTRMNFFSRFLMNRTVEVGAIQ